MGLVDDLLDLDTTCLITAAVDAAIYQRKLLQEEGILRS